MKFLMIIATATLSILISTSLMADCNRPAIFERVKKQMKNEDIGTKLCLVTKLSGDETKREITLLSITHDDNGIPLYVFGTDLKGNIKLIDREKKNPNTRGNYRAWTVEQLNDGVYYMTKKKHKIVKLINESGENFVDNMKLKIDYLVNGVTGSRGSFTIKVTKTVDQDGAVQFQMHTDQSTHELIKPKTLIRNLHFTSKVVLLLGTVGVKDVLFNNQAIRRMLEL